MLNVLWQHTYRNVLRCRCNIHNFGRFLPYPLISFQPVSCTAPLFGRTLQDLPQIGCMVVLSNILLQVLSTYINYLIFFLPSRSLTVSLQASCQYFPDSRNFSFAIRSFSNWRSVVLNCLIVRVRSTCFSNLFSTKSIAGQVMSGTFGAFLRIFDQ